MRVLYFFEYGLLSNSAGYGGLQTKFLAGSLGCLILSLCSNVVRSDKVTNCWEWDILLTKSRESIPYCIGQYGQNFPYSGCTGTKAPLFHLRLNTSHIGVVSAVLR